MKYRLILSLCIAFVLIHSFILAQNGVTFLGHLDQKHGTSGDGISYSACWGYVAPNGKEYAIVGTYTGTSIIDITSTDSIREITHITGSTSIWREMRTYKERAYVVSEGGSGVQIINLSNLPNSANLVRSFNYTSGGKNILRNHSIEIFDGYMYLNGSANWSPGGVLIFSLANVDSPAYVGQYQQEYCHDSYVKGNRLYAAAINSGGLNIANISNKANPTHITKITYSGAGTHNAWTTVDGNTVITTDEIGSTAKNLKFWNVSSIPPAPSTPISTYTINPNDIVHNVFVRGGYAYVAWYTAGMAVVNISDPSTPATAGWYDSSFEPSGNYDGVWAVYPYYWSGKIIAGDMQNGLYVLKFNDLAARKPVSLLEPANYQTYCSASSINFKWSRVADPVKDPHLYWFSLKGPGVDTTYVLSTDTAFTLNNVNALQNGTYKWYITTKDEANQIATRDTFRFVKTTQFVTVTSPDTATSLKAESNATITWNSGCIDSVELAYSTNNGSTWNAIASSVPASAGSYVWAVPKISTSAGRIRVRWVSDTTVTDISNAAFSIYISTNVHLLSPNGGELWESGTTEPITWTSLNVDSVMLEYSTDSGSTWEEIAASVPAVSGSYDWLIPELGVTTPATVRISDASNPATKDGSDASFTIHHTSVALYLLSPSGGENWQVGTQHNISWTELAVDSLAIEYSLDSGATWQTIVPAVAAAESSYLWTVPSPSILNAFIRVRNLGDSTIADMNETAIHIPLLSVDAGEDWNVVSVPAHTPDFSVSNLFPGAISEAYEYAGTYTEIETARIGKGFWLKFPSVATLYFYGEPVLSETVDVGAKWNIIGSLTDSVSVASIATLPNTMTLSSFFSYSPEDGYSAVTALQPGKGYWVKTSEAGQLILSTESMSAKRLMESVSNERFNEVVFTSASRSSRTLRIGDGASLLQSELPPVPPSGVFDVRFASGRQAETFGDGKTELPIQIHSASYPMTISVQNSAGQKFALIETNKGIRRKLHSFAERHSVVLSSAPVGMLSLMQEEGESRPIVYALSQNYPNPFNPVTSISYSIGERSQVSLKVFNMLGEEIATLVKETKDAGLYSVAWDATSLPSGIYVYRLNAGNYSETRKMVLTK